MQSEKTFVGDEDEGTVTSMAMWMRVDVDKVKTYPPLLSPTSVSS